MKNTTYENQGNSTYLVYEIDSTDIVDNLSLGMINNNKIIGLAPVIYSQVDDKKYLKYNISAKVSAATFLAGAASRNRILGIFSSVSKALLSAEEYMLDANTIMLDLDYIYVDVTTCEAELICLPIQRGNFNDVVSFFRNIIFSITYDQTENCDYVAKMIGCLNNHSSFSLQNFMQTIDELNGKRINLENLQSSQQPEPNYTEILHGESQEIKSVAENVQKISSQSPLIQLQSGQNDGNQQILYPYGSQMGSLQEEMRNYYSQDPLQGNQQNIPSNSGIVSGYQTMENGMMPQKNSFLTTGQKAMPPAEQNRKKGRGLLRFFHKRNKAKNAANTPPNMTGRNQQIPNGIGNIPNGTNQMTNGAGNIPSNIIGRNQQIPNGMGNMQPNSINQQFMPPHGVENTNHQYTERILDFGQTTVLDSSMETGQTSVLSTSIPAQPYLLRKKNGEKVFINKTIFRIGKEASYVDYFIGDNSAISRSHANIIIDGKEYYIVDTNSKNHTYVNGQMIQSNIETLLTHGSVIKLANEEFEFRMY